MRSSITRSFVKQYLIDSKQAPCQACGESYHYSVMEYHHINPESKRFKLSAASSGNVSGLTKEMIDEEIAKCCLLCANCHRLGHNGIIPFPQLSLSDRASGT